MSLRLDQSVQELPAISSQSCQASDCHCRKMLHRLDQICELQWQSDERQIWLPMAGGSCTGWSNLRYTGQIYDFRRYYVRHKEEMNTWILFIAITYPNTLKAQYFHSAFELSLWIWDMVYNMCVLSKKVGGREEVRKCKTTSSRFRYEKKMGLESRKRGWIEYPNFKYNLCPRTKK